MKIRSVGSYFKSLFLGRKKDMFPLTEQKEIMDTLYGAMLSSIEGDFDRAECKFSYETSKDKSYSVGSSFYYELNGRIFYCPLSEQALGEISVAVPALHRLMKEAGQGNWGSFTMSFPRDGAVSLKFHYVESGS